MSFAQLRQNRQAKQASSFAQRTPLDKDSSVHQGSIQPTEAVSKKWAGSPELYKDLPEFVEIRSSESGRGLYVRSEGVKSIKAGSTILLLPPLVNVLSTRCLPSHCSYCHVEGPPSALKHCGKCKVVCYDSPVCQRNDWGKHKQECHAITRWMASGSGGPSGNKADNTSVPTEAIRVLGRLLWEMERSGPGSSWSQEIAHMQSHRSSLPPQSPAHGTLASLAHSLAKYLDITQDPSAFNRWGIQSARDLVDLLSKFTTNSFTLTDPVLTPIGVCISPSAALINHSCAPNAVVVFPQPKSSRPNPLMVIALRDIEPGQEILSSYIDITLPGPRRRHELKENYMFDCNCSACSNSEPDPRESLRCPKCTSLVPLPLVEAVTEGRTDLPGSPVICARCNSTLVNTADECQDAIKICRDALDSATNAQFSDITRALRYTTNSIALLRPIPLHIACDPLLALTRLHQTLLISKIFSGPPPSSLGEQHSRDAEVDEACGIAARNVAGVSAILPYGHPVRGVALAELGKLLCVDVDPSTETSPSSASASASASRLISGTRIVGENAAVPRGYARVELAIQVLLRARDELQIGFGRETGDGGGGQAGRDVRGMLQELEREVETWRKVNVVERGR
ncbi:hypothetical protein BS47DRAFT_1481760 [Hydnum rufescens UP504]|uniref:SET domain-containing protein n=1 Tax=Hydnum rufescens UP504 TaxID=1448309 RepID=A0A9P6E1P6_9AGAM|nr:hypothetical protein BS47DRAFT_1481760 [Hydnum rufescens UP504]